MSCLRGSFPRRLSPFVRAFYRIMAPVAPIPHAKRADTASTPGAARAPDEEPPVVSTTGETQPLAIDTRRVHWYRCPIEPETLRELTERSDLRGSIQALGHLAVAAGTGALTVYCFLAELWIAFALALFAHGTVASHLHYGCHELGHGTVFRTKWLNAVFLRIYSVFAWWNYHEYGMSHTHHHLYTLHPRGDREVVLPFGPAWKPLYLLQLFSLNVTGGMHTKGIEGHILATFATAFDRYGVFFRPDWMRSLYAGRPEARRTAVNWARVVILCHAGIAVASIASGYWIVAVVVSLGPVIANWHSYFVGGPMHCGLRDNVPDFRKCVRTITLDPVSEFLYWHMNWHLEHHMFAAVPCYNLAKLHRAVADDMPEPRTLAGAWREIREVWRRQEEDPGYQYDTPVPNRSGPAAALQSPEAAAIGDIAPRELRVAA